MGPARPGRLQERQGLLVQPDGQLRRPRRLLAAIPLDRAIAAYVTDPAFLEFYRLTVGEYIEAWDKDGDGIPEHRPEYGYRGLGGYDEGPFSDQGLYGSDLIAAMARAFDSYAAGSAGTLGSRRGRRRRSFCARAGGPEEALRRRLVERGEGPVTPTAASRAAPSSTRTSIWNGVFPLYFGFVPAGPRRDSTLRRIVDAKPEGIEIESYLPEILYRYGQDEAAYARILALTDPAKERREYPEVPFAVVGRGRDRASWASGPTPRRGRSRRAPGSRPRRLGPSCAASRSSTASSTSVTTARLARRSPSARADTRLEGRLRGDVGHARRSTASPQTADHGDGRSRPAVSWVKVPMSAGSTVDRLAPSGARLDDAGTERVEWKIECDPSRTSEQERDNRPPNRDPLRRRIHSRLRSLLRTASFAAAPRPLASLGYAATAPMPPAAGRPRRPTPGPAASRGPSAATTSRGRRSTRSRCGRRRPSIPSSSTRSSAGPRTSASTRSGSSSTTSSGSRTRAGSCAGSSGSWRSPTATTSGRCSSSSTTAGTPSSPQGRSRRRARASTTRAGSNVRAPDLLESPGRWGILEAYTKGVVGFFREDRRVLAWDLYNEPGNSGLRFAIAAPAPERLRLGPRGRPEPAPDRRHLGRVEGPSGAQPVPGRAVGHHLVPLLPDAGRRGKADRGHEGPGPPGRLHRIHGPDGRQPLRGHPAALQGPRHRGHELGLRPGQDSDGLSVGFEGGRP
ncbi:MAG: hypothetical protein MZV63_14305 [Marinilabiliales bacterium]|nr:hypothetical protein [Marinilabiliales bacterium]